MDESMRGVYKNGEGWMATYSNRKTIGKVIKYFSRKEDAENYRLLLEKEYGNPSDLKNHNYKDRTGIKYGNLTYIGDSPIATPKGSPRALFRNNITNKIEEHTVGNVRKGDVSGFKGLDVSPRKNNSSGIPGVSYQKNRNTWFAYIWIKSKRINLGYYSDIEDAKKARKNAMTMYLEKGEIPQSHAKQQLKETK